MKKIHFILALTFFHLGLVQGQIYLGYTHSMKTPRMWQCDLIFMM